jgi:hypothetical protein
VTNIITRWAGIESEELNPENWIQVGFRFIGQEGEREYRVFGQLYGEDFEETYSSEYDDAKSLAYSYFAEQLKRIESAQTWLYDAYEVWDHDFVEVACETCAVEFAKEHSLEWSGGKSADSYTENSEELNAGASCIASYALGDSDYPHTCVCGVYLTTNFTTEGEDYLRENFPKGVQKLYSY